MKSDTTFAIATAPKRDSRHWKLGTVTWGEMLAWMDDPGTAKEAGNYLLGTLHPTSVAHVRSRPDDRCLNIHRRKDAVDSRSCLTLDVDFAEETFVDQVELTLPAASIVHTTFSSTPDEPRYRVIIPLSREAKPDEYIHVAAAVMILLGEEQFDPGTTQPERYMFKPAAPDRRRFKHWTFDGPALDVDTFLSDFDADLSAKPIPRPSRHKRNPFELEGVIGAFNRAYRDWDLLIETYELPYEKLADDRYQLVGARSVAGMGPVAEAEGLVYSHHASDPAYGKACSAFDLVRLHRFGDLDEESNPQTPITKLPSHMAMSELASGDHRVTAELVQLDFSDLTDDEGNVDDTHPDAWKLGIDWTNRGSMKDKIANWDLVRDHDPVLGLLYYNELTLSVEVMDHLPWRKVDRLTKLLSATDRMEFVDYFEREYHHRPVKTRMDAVIDTKAMQHSVNPVREYLEGLVWDGTPRVETCLPGVSEHTDYTRLVARKSLAAAVARMYDPGCKWDHTLVLFGAEGLGKTTWIERLARGYTSSLGRIGDKDTLLAMQRSWIVVSDEGHSLRKGDADVLKEFLTRTHDVFRLPYDRETHLHPRHCVIWSTTNDKTFLRNQEGNRRFLIVTCDERMDFEAMTPEYVDQLWAEAVALYKGGEPLWLDTPEAEALAAAERAPFVEEDSIYGMIQEYLDKPVHADWDVWSVERRVSWLSARADGLEAEGTLELTQVCSAQIGVEALNRRHGEQRRVDLLEITNALKNTPGWRALPGRHRCGPYGPQLVFERIPEENFEDLI